MDIQSRANHTIDGNINENKKKSFIEKAKEHKKEIAIGAVAILSVVTIVLIVKNKTTIEAAIKSTHQQHKKMNIQIFTQTPYATCTYGNQAIRALEKSKL